MNVTVFNWIMHAIIYCVILGSIYGLISFGFFKKELKFFIRYLKR